MGWGELLGVTLTEDSKFLITASSNTVRTPFLSFSLSLRRQLTRAPSPERRGQVVSVFRLDRNEGEQRLAKSRESPQSSAPKCTLCPPPGPFFCSLF